MFYAKKWRNGIKLVLEHNFDLILLDIMMPDMNGFDVCEKLKMMIKQKKYLLFFFIRKRFISRY